MDDVVRQHGRLHAGAAHLVDRRGAGGVGQSGAARGLPRRSLALTGRQHIAHENLVNAFRRQFRPLQRGADDVTTELVRADGRQFTHEPAERRAGGGKDDDGIGACGHRGFSCSIDIIGR